MHTLEYLTQSPINVNAFTQTVGN